MTLTRYTEAIRSTPVNMIETTDVLREATLAENTGNRRAAPLAH
jgi:hypothetical protein